MGSPSWECGIKIPISREIELCKWGRCKLQRRQSGKLHFNWDVELFATVTYLLHSLCFNVLKIHVRKANICYYAEKGSKTISPNGHFSEITYIYVAET